MNCIEFKGEPCKQVLYHEPKCVVEDPRAKVGQVRARLVTLQQNVVKVCIHFVCLGWRNKQDDELDAGATESLHFRGCIVSIQFYNL